MVGVTLREELGGARVRRVPRGACRRGVVAVDRYLDAPTGASTRMIRARLPPMMFAHVLLGQPRRQVVDVAARLGQALGVRLVGTEQHVVGADHVDDLAEVVLVERADVDVAA